MKEYPPRKKIISRSMCECGHPWYSHEVTNKSAFLALFRGMEKTGGKCRDCMCPEFHFEEWST